MMHVQKNPLRQSRLLTVQEIPWLHALLISSHAHPFDKAFCGYILICLYGRCRHSDLRMVHSIVVDYDQDGGFIEISARNHKNAKTVSLQSVLLPIVLPALGITGSLWYDDVRAAFHAVGLKSTGVIDGPVFRPPQQMDVELLCERGITSEEVTKFLRVCFERDKVETTFPPGPSVAKISSHALKATLLSWMSKHGCDPSIQASLGRQCLP